ncbi:VOC family protein [Desulfofustis limnaeus]|jgi:catechol 2,3-dioxygenase-like lactoylglutathione lyase family enzyme|uniref:Diguanylate cyclase n=1 Tax=Desulfofustis limnaeus TaxID=2740163 RepID=A0ABN6M950_9BACT|nr:VOC family protein [Desulfofustis limnaeus]MDX9896691.1 hypothetical protein [Desulfofustis sp.]BDD89403.1 diguanylate cyclase [Desulfofustis limnaeus]
MIVTGLRHFTISAPTELIDRCLSFYTSVLNLRLGFRPPLATDGFWLYGGEQDLIHLEISEPGETFAGGCCHIALSCINLPAAIRRLEDLSIDYATEHLAETDQFQIFVKDPCGHTVELNFPCERL